MIGQGSGAAIVTYDATEGLPVYLSTTNFTLPVSLLSFTGRREGNTNRLFWTTASENNNKGFAIQRSYDGINYNTIGFVNSQSQDGNSSSVLEYSFTNDEPSTAFYRLLQTDLDGNTQLSPVVILKSAPLKSFSISKLYPNPVTGRTINVVVETNTAGKAQLLLTDLAGRPIMVTEKKLVSGVNAFVLEVGELASGNYYLKMTSPNGETVKSSIIKP
jgi:hypothetical protein